MYIVGIAVCLLACGYGIYRYGMRRGVEVTFDFFIDNLETNGYVVNIYNEKVEYHPISTDKITSWYQKIDDSAIVIYNGKYK